MRVFVAVQPPLAVVEDLQEFLEPRASAPDPLAVRGRSGWRWSRPEQLHLTLAFVPDLDRALEERVIQAGQDWAQRQHPVDLQICGAGAFPDPGSAKVLWVGLQDPQATQRLTGWAHGIRGVISHAGGRPEGRAFRPHVTVARSRTPGGQAAGRLLQSIDTYRSPAWRVETVSLIQSCLGDGPGGSPRYDVLHEWVLGQGS